MNHLVDAEENDERRKCAKRGCSKKLNQGYIEDYCPAHNGEENEAEKDIC